MYLNRILLIAFLVLSSTILKAQTTMYVSSETLNMRSGPSTDYAIVAKLSKGDAVTVSSTANGWALVNHNGNTGYVSYKYLSNSTQSVAERTVPKKTEAMVLICESNSAYAYHAYQCHGLNRCKASISKVTVSDAKSQGYVPCKICY